jgi:hypothetical protein
MATRLQAAYADAERASASAMRRAVHRLGEGRLLEKADGCSLLGEMMAEIEGVIKGVVAPHSALYWISVLRRLPPIVAAKYEQTKANISFITHLACAKYGGSAAPGEFVEVPRDEGGSGWASGRRQVPHVSPADLAQALTILGLCDAFYGLTATYRRIGKGFAYRVAEDDLLELPADCELTELVELYDRRQDKFATAFATVGLFYPDEQMRWIGKHPRIMTVGPATRPPSDGTIELASHRLALIPPYEVRFGLGFDDLDGIWPYLDLVSEAFERNYGISPKDAALCLSALSFVWSGQARNDPLGLIQVITRGGCVMSEQNLREYLIGNIPAVSEFHYGASIDSKEAGRITDRFLRLAWVEPDAIDLQLMRPKGLIFGHGEQVFVDLTRVHAFLGCVVADTELAAELKEIKGGMFELEVETYLHECGSPVFSTQDGRTAKTFIKDKSTLGQADCCRLHGSVLVLIDAKAYKIPAAYDRGDYSAVQTRVAYVRSWLDQADRLADSLRDNPVGSNFDLHALNVSHVLTVVCTPYTEYTPERSSRFFLERDTPRVCTPSELRTYLLGHAPEVLRENPNSRRVAGSADHRLCGPRLFGLVMERSNSWARMGGHANAVDPPERGTRSDPPSVDRAGH